ncbi:hemerythrin domain-containing protein [Ilumatobacter sp.]|uniref:hemerythrin domain-containing protein n=1 Tax=Ilumatobacter sp. TaxID=1967498 RepID=UPI003C43B890
MTEHTSTITAPSTVTSSPVAAPPADLYREVHKGLRRAMFEIVECAGALDATDADAVNSLRQLFADLDMMLVTHHGHEDGPLLAGLIAEHAGDLTESIEAAHAATEHQLRDLRTMVAALDARSATDVYDRLVAFTADYLTHMNVEERQVMPRLQAAATDDELMEIEMAIRTSVPPTDMCVFLRPMLLAMNPDERAGTLAGMKMGAPPEIFELFWGVAERTLAPADLAVVVDRIDALAVAS